MTRTSLFMQLLPVLLAATAAQAAGGTPHLRDLPERPDTLTISGYRPDSIPVRRPADSATIRLRPFIRPPYLQEGDTVGIVSPAGRMPKRSDTAKVRERIESWGLHVKFGAHYADREQPYFAGTDAQRAADLQQMIDDPSVKAVIAYRGGYGSVRLLPLLRLEGLREHPKWIVGFSDITLLHLVLRRLGVESIHGAMPGSFVFDEEDPSAESLREALFGLRDTIATPPHPLNCPGTASGRLAGGNMVQLLAAMGTPEELEVDTPTVLFIEEVGEFVYRIDRMMQSLLRSGKLRNLRAVIVGHFSDMQGLERFGVTDPYEVLDPYLRPLGIPVVYGFPAGHAAPNRSLYMGREVTVEVDGQGARVRF